MLEDIIRCDIERELEKRSEQARFDVTLNSEGSESTCIDYSGQLDVLISDVSEKMAAIRTPVPDNPYPTVLEGPKWKVFIKRFVRKMTWWFFNRFAVVQHWRNEMLSASVESLAGSVKLLETALSEQEMQIRKLNEEPAERDRIIGSMQKEITASKQYISEQEMQIRKLNEELAERDRIIRFMQKEITASNQYIEEEKRIAESENVGRYIDYLEFENEFRGSQEEIKRRVEHYLDYFIPGQKVLDLGCGRGEWLELLKKYGVDAVGIDINSRCVEMCLVKQLNALQSDMFTYLENVEDASLDGITSLQVIEHITPAQLGRLVELCRRKLRTGGILILETPNPAVSYTMTANFYVDPTHIRPVHPNWLKYLLEHSGFNEVKIDYQDYSVIWEGAQPYTVVEENQADANRRVDFLNRMLFGPTDFACIAKKIK